MSFIRSLCAFLLPMAVLFVTPATALDIPVPSQADSRVRWVNYNEWDVTRIIGTERSAIAIVFDETEQILDGAPGDSVAWETKRRGHIIYLKAREPHPPTNLIVTTIRGEDGSTRVYNFELIARKGDVVDSNSDMHDPDVYFTIKFRYPEDKARRSAAQAEAKRQKAQELVAMQRLHNAVTDTKERNWRYLVAGDTSIAPVAAYDTGEITVLTFARGTQLPSVYIIGPDGAPYLANTTVRRNEVLVHAVVEEIHLRRGSAIAGVFNRGFLRGRHAETGTVSHHVRRDIIQDNGL